MNFGLSTFLRKTHYFMGFVTERSSPVKHFYVKLFLFSLVVS